MKYVWRLAFWAVLLSPTARAEVQTIKRTKTAQLRAFQNLNARLARLEDYSVGYLSADGKKYEVIKSAPARQWRKSGAELKVVLRPAKPKRS